MTRDEWSSSILPFQGEERKGQHLFQKRKGARRALMVPKRRGDWRMQRHDIVRQRPVAGVERHLD
jgi:hypothetical protein